MKQISKANGIAARDLAAKTGKMGKPAYLKWGESLLRFPGESEGTYMEGNVGDLGFCNDAARAAWGHGGIWI